MSLRSLSYGYYCNIFVADVVREAGGATWEPIPERLGVNPTRDPVAKEWADPGFAINGWTVIFHSSRAGNLTAKQILALREPGDIVSDGRHVGIVSDERKLISASSVTGAVEHNDYSFKLPNQSQFSSAAEYERVAKEQISQYTVRRYEGNQ